MRIYIHSVLWNIIDILFPPRCASCQTWGERLCTACIEAIEVISGKVCDFCGEPIVANGSGVCLKCQTAQVYLNGVRSWAYFSGPVKKAVYGLKYQRDLGLGSALSKPMIDMILRQNWKVDLIIPVPLNPLRKKERGYNQAALLAEPLSVGTGIPISKNILRRVRYTKSQVGLSIIQREKNMHLAFEANTMPRGVDSVLLIDDVVTTGATLNACAAALKDAGAMYVYALTLARSLRL